MAIEITNQDQSTMHSIPMDSFDKLTVKLAILHANLQLIHGEGAENFRTLSGEIQDTYIWGCATLAAEALELANPQGDN